MTDYPEVYSSWVDNCHFLGKEPVTNDSDPFDRDEDMRYRDDPGYNEVVEKRK